jgi:hypothetical protein
MRCFKTSYLVEGKCIKSYTSYAYYSSVSFHAECSFDNMLYNNVCLRIFKCNSYLSLSNNIYSHFNCTNAFINSAYINPCLNRKPYIVKRAVQVSLPLFIGVDIVMRGGLKQAQESTFWGSVILHIHTQPRVIYL